MNDRFKFRVWSEEDCGYMESIDIFRLTHGGKLVFNNDSLNREPECNPKRYICEQCTGLKDKKGKLIYDGDIVEHKILPDKPKRYIVKWSYTHLCFELQSIKNQLFYDVFIPAYDDVIGNIHENPELLKEKE